MDFHICWLGPLASTPSQEFTVNLMSLFSKTVEYGKILYFTNTVFHFH